MLSVVADEIVCTELDTDLDELARFDKGVMVERRDELQEDAA